ncbi:hypothetical protein F5146DRAFT_1077138 [Armillaria mellea]|nr:hypothetical protein F5146DRAFT_1077138 [Armillaria mellea]
MSSIVLPPRGQCIQVTDNLQHCQCPSFVSTLDQLICGRCGHGIHAHRDYVSMFVHHCPAMNCAAYYPKTSWVQACTCSASLIEHIPVVNVYRSLATLPYGANTLPSNVTTFTGDTANIPFTPVPIPSNDNTSYSYGDAVIFAPTPHRIIQLPFTQIDTHSHSEVENPTRARGFPRITRLPTSQCMARKPGRVMARLEKISVKDSIIHLQLLRRSLYEGTRHNNV